MAVKKPRNYPTLPGVPKKLRELPRRRSLNETIPVKYNKRIWADWYVKSTKAYTQNYLNSNDVIMIGSNSKAGVSNPGWRVNIAKGADATSNYSRSGYLIYPTRYNVTTESSAYISRGFGVYLGDYFVTPHDYTPLQDKALGRLKNKLKGKVGNAKLAAPLAESREIGRLVRQINGIGMDVFKALLAAKASKGKSVIKTASDIWLGFGFGVNPLLQDIKHAADAILHYTTREDSRVIVSGTATEDYISGSPFPRSYSFAGETIAYQTRIGFQTRTRHRQGVKYVCAYDLKVRSAANYSVANHLGLELGQLPSALWELTPYSWVVDYFTTVGSWLDDVFYTVPGDCVYAFLNQKYLSESTSTAKAYPNSGFTSTMNGAATIVRYFSFSRQKLAGLPTRDLRIKSVDEIANHGITKLLNLGSVIAGRRGPKL